MSKQAEKLYNGITNIDEQLVEEAQEKYEEKRSNKRVPVWKYAGIAASLAIIAAAGISVLIHLPETYLSNGNTDVPPGSAGGMTPLMTTAAPSAATEAAAANAVQEISWEEIPVGYMSNSAVSEQLTEPVYPYIPQYPDGSNEISNDEEVREKFQNDYTAWSKAIQALTNRKIDYSERLDGFFADSMRTFLTDNDGKNAVYSPTSLYMALGMSAEITDGNSRQQILDLLRYRNIEELRENAAKIWNANYMDDGMAKCLLASSVWLNNRLNYSERTLTLLSEEYKSASFIGEMGNADYDKLLRSWLNEQTGGQLEDFVSGISLDQQTVISLATTVDYCGKWNSKFDKGLTDTGTFHTANGDKQCDYMHKRSNMSYYWGDKFASINMPLENNGYMLLLLPDEGVTPEELLNDKQAMDFMLNDPYKFKNNKYTEVELSLPKFDISANLDLTDGLKALGLTDIFDAGTADFTPLTDSADVALSTAKHAARVQIDEEGCKASALTIMSYVGAAMPDGKVTMTFDRPFLFEIVGTSRMPLFVGIVNDPFAN